MHVFSDWLAVHSKNPTLPHSGPCFRSEYEGNPLDLPQFTAKSGREVASYQHVEAWILRHVPLDSFSNYHGGGTSNHVECFNSCMSRGGNKNVNMCSGRSQATTCWGVLNKKVYGDSWEQRAEALPRVQSPLTQAI